MEKPAGAAAAAGAGGPAAPLFSQVVFTDIPHSYPPGTSITCSFTLCAAFKPTSRDWVGIFKVGWSTTKEYHTFVWVEPRQDVTGQQPASRQAAFKDYYLPRDDSEFYQFCYVDGGGQVRGASTPFCFSSPAEQSLERSLERNLELHLDDDLLVITTQEQVEQSVREKAELQSELDQTRAEMETLRKDLQSERQAATDLETERDEKEKERSELVKELNHMREEKKMQEEAVKQQQDDVERQKAQLSLQRADGAQDGKRTRSLSTAGQNGEEKYERAVMKINQLKEERDQLKRTNKAQSEELKQLKAKVREAERERSKSADIQQLLEVDLQSSQQEAQRLEAELQRLQGVARSVEEVQKENRELNGQLRQKETQQSSQDGDLQAECQSLARQLDDAKAKLAVEKEEVRSGRRREEQVGAEVQRHLESVVTKYEEEQRKSGKLELYLGEMNKVMADKDLAMEEMENKVRAMEEKDATIQLKRDEIDQLTRENQALKSNVEGLRRVCAEYHSAASASNSPRADGGTSSGDVPVGTPHDVPEPDQVLYQNLGNLAAPQEEEALVCPHCQELFPGITPEELVLHEQTHRVCPFCTLICDHMDQSVFEDHVYSHEV